MTEQDKRAIKALCFPDITEARRAYQCAEDIRRCAEDIRRLDMPSPWIRLTLAYLGSSPRRWRLVADALEGKTRRFQTPTPTRENVVTAWYKAYYCAGLLQSGPTLVQVKAAFIELFGKEGLPSDWSITKILRRLNLPFRKGKVGRPRKKIATDLAF
jgi:hypothetical protein